MSINVAPAVTPAGFLLHAREFLSAAELVLTRATHVSLPAYFLYGRSIELSLKAFLLAAGVSIAQLRSREFGHNLDSLLKLAIERGLLTHVSLDQREIGVVDLLSQNYADKTYEYRVTHGQYLLPLIDVTETVARRLVVELDNLCSGANGAN